MPGVISSQDAGLLADAPGAVPGDKVRQLLVLNWLLAPRNEHFVHEKWFPQTAMDVRLKTDARVADKDRLLYDLTSTCFEGDADPCPGSNAAARVITGPIAKQLVLALIVISRKLPADLRNFSRQPTGSRDAL